MKYDDYAFINLSRLKINTSVTATFTSPRDYLKKETDYIKNTFDIDLVYNNKKNIWDNDDPIFIHSRPNGVYLCMVKFNDQDKKMLFLLEHSECVYSLSWIRTVKTYDKYTVHPEMSLKNYMKTNYNSSMTNLKDTFYKKGWTFETRDDLFKFIIENRNHYLIDDVG